HQEERQRVDFIRQSALNLLTIVNDMLDFTSMDAGKLTLQNNRFDLHRLLGDLQATFQDSARQKGLELGARLGPNLPATLVQDADRLRQILTNLLSNAIKFTPPGGKVVLGAEPTRREKESFWIRFLVQDTGIGIHPDQFSRLFKLFSPGDGPTTSKLGGAGLGLMITKRLIKLMGGYIHVDSSVNKGTLFTVDLPFLHPVFLEEPVACAAQGEGHSFPPHVRLLLVDDDSVNRVVVRGILRRHGFAIEEAVNGMEALEKLVSHTYDLVLMDCQMPHMDGYTACQMFREKESGQQHKRRTPIIALTANAMQGDREKCLEAGMDDYLAKPIRGEDLKRLLSHWLFGNSCRNC
ncbi:MAG: response regulator, partial [Magnetococcales bacterium]|nr:response regulator [Magnetococcales bacterium]